MSTTNTKFSAQTIGLIYAIASAALFSMRPVIVKLVYVENVDSTTLLTLRMLFSIPLYLLLLFYLLRDPEKRERLNNSILLKISMVGLLGYYGASLLDLIGLQYITAQLGRLILFTYPTFVVIFGALFFAKKITLRTTVSLFITYLGTAVIFAHDLQTFGSDVIKGGFFVISSAILFAFYLLFSKPLINVVGSRIFTCIALLAASIGILCHFALSNPIDYLSISSRALFLIFLIAIFCTVIPSFFTAAAISNIGPDKSSIVATVGPAFTSIFAINLLGEDFTIFHALGIGLTIIGVIILGANRATKQPRA